MFIDFKKYKRFFAFGCSFTRYTWPTWANLISKQMSHAEFYNFGKPGAGNQYISYTVAEVNQKFKFNKDDLVIILWSTFTREDRFINNEWLTYGNVYNNPLYDDTYLRKFADEKGFIYRDLALMELVDGYLMQQCKYIGLLSTPPVINSENPGVNKYGFDDINQKFEKLLSKFPKSMFELEFPNGWEIDYSTDIDGGHPSTIRYFNYLQKLGIELSDDVKIYAQDCSKFLSSASTREEVIRHFEKK